MLDGSTSVWQKARLSDSTTSKLKSFSFVLEFNTVHFEMKFLKFAGILTLYAGKDSK